jgi:hypothetical protein
MFLGKGFVSMSQVVHVGSNANNGEIAGVFYLNSNNDSSNANRNIGSQHAVYSGNRKQTPARKGEYVNPIQFGSYGEELGEHQR